MCSMRFAEAIHAREPGGAGAVPLTAFQAYTIQRLRLDARFDLSVDSDRYAALLWYLEHYSAQTKPLRAPLSAEQIAWLLQPSGSFRSERLIPQVAESFWHRAPDALPNPFAGGDAYLKFAYWWSVEYAPELRVEHALIPDAFVDALSIAPFGAPQPAPLNAFIRMFMARHPDVAWSESSEAERLACYIKALACPRGVHHSLFMPETVLKRLAAAEIGTGDVTSLAQCDAPSMASRLRQVIEAALAYRAKHKLLRRAQTDAYAGVLGRTWEGPASTNSRAKTPSTAYGLPSDLRVRVIGPLNSQSGLGQASRMSVQALQSVGIVAETLAFDLENPSPRKLAFADTAVADMRPGSINLLHLNAEAVPLAAAYLDPRLFENAYNIGYFFWELARPARCHTLALRQLDEVWTSSEFNRASYAAAGAKVTKVGMATQPSAERADQRSAVRSAFGLPEDTTVFMTTCDGFSFLKRKNPAGAARAFRMAFPGGENVRLVIKTHNLGVSDGVTNSRLLLKELQELVAADPRIILMDGTIHYDELMALKSSCDAYLSLHRSEGWGFGLIEAMQLGLPVIATAYSGNLDFCKSSTSFLVPYVETYLSDGDYIFTQPGDVWAEPDLYAAAEHLRFIYAQPAEAKRMGLAGMAFVAENFSKEAVGRLYVARLQDIALGISRRTAEVGISQ